MLTDEQCIEIAEKVWGWKITELEPPNFPETWWRDAEGNKKFPVYETATTIYSQALKNEILSWQGFGRTISNISRILKNEHELEDFMFDAGPNFDSLIKGLITEDEFFELIQTAALEVLKDG